jgi:hypothetical protein
MKITRLGWAGLELEVAGEIAVIDLLQSTEPMRQFMGEPHTELPPPSRSGTAALALVTHLHEDHTDAAAIAAALGPDGVLLRPAPDEGEFLEVAGFIWSTTGRPASARPTGYPRRPGRCRWCCAPMNPMPR